MQISAYEAIARISDSNNVQSNIIPTQLLMCERNVSRNVLADYNLCELENKLFLKTTALYVNFQLLYLWLFLYL